MARALKPGHKPYGAISVLEEEKFFYLHGDSQLGKAGYDPRTERLELTCVLAPGQHIRPYEIYGIRHDLKRCCLSDGKRLRSIRVTFLEKDDAESEKRPLLDVGAEVFCFDAQGKHVKIADWT